MKNHKEIVVKLKMSRVKFKKGYQKKFFQEVLIRINCPSLRELRKRGFDVSYSSLKNYFSERRNIPEELFNDLIHVSKIDKDSLEFETVDDNYGQVIGGKKSKKNGLAKN